MFPAAFYIWKSFFYIFTWWILTIQLRITIKFVCTKLFHFWLGDGQLVLGGLISYTRDLFLRQSGLNILIKIPKFKIHIKSTLRSFQFKIITCKPAGRHSAAVTQVHTSADDKGEVLTTPDLTYYLRQTRQSLDVMTANWTPLTAKNGR